MVFNQLPTGLIGYLKIKISLTIKSIQHAKIIEIRKQSLMFFLTSHTLTLVLHVYNISEIIKYDSSK